MPRAWSEHWRRRSRSRRIHRGLSHRQRSTPSAQDAGNSGTKAEDRVTCLGRRRLGQRRPKLPIMQGGCLLTVNLQSVRSVQPVTSSLWFGTSTPPPTRIAIYARFGVVSFPFTSGFGACSSGKVPGGVRGGDKYRSVETATTGGERRERRQGRNRGGG